jgi:hypothetical protein
LSLNCDMPNLALQTVISEMSVIVVFPMLFSHRNAITAYGWNFSEFPFQFVGEIYWNTALSSHSSTSKSKSRSDHILTATFLQTFLGSATNQVVPISNWIDWHWDNDVQWEHNIGTVAEEGRCDRNSSAMTPFLWYNGTNWRMTMITWHECK